MSESLPQIRLTQHAAQALYEVGQVLSTGDTSQENSQRHLISAKLQDFRQALKQLTQCEGVSQLAKRFALDPMQQSVLAFAYILTTEPETLSPFLKTSWFERGPSLSLYRMVSMLTEENTSAVIAKLIHSALFKWHLLRWDETVHLPISDVTVEPNVMAFISGAAVQANVEQMEGRQLDVSQSDADKLSPVHINIHSQLQLLSAELLDAHELCYKKALSKPPGKMVEVQCYDIDERLMLVKSYAAKQHRSHCLLLDQPKNPPRPELLTEILRDTLLLSSNPFLYWPCAVRYCQYYPDLLNLTRDWLALSHDGSLLFDATDGNRLATAQSASESTSSDAHLQPASQGLLGESTLSFMSLECGHVSVVQRAKVWQSLSALTKSSVLTKNSAMTKSSALSRSDANWLAQLYPLSLGVISRICREQLPKIRETDKKRRLRRIQTICMTYHQQQHNDLATLVEPKANPPQLVLPTSVLSQIREISSRLKFSATLDAEIPGFRVGIRALFWGKPGTGKSMAAETIATELMLPLYRVNLANVASKWIGESEKHLAKLFEQAEQQRAILLFDEADAIFGKRSEIKNAQDKNANMGISYLLQRIENYSGLLILTTNFKNNLDPAFLRRFHNVVEFSMPDEKSREILWQNIWTGTLQPDKTIKVEQLAKVFDFSPAQIANIAELSVLLSLELSTKTIRPEILSHAIVRELDKQNAGFVAQQKVKACFQ